jgi:CheY-like chemotaxis protein
MMSSATTKVVAGFGAKPTMTGNETYTAHDGLEAVEAAEKHRPDAILLDIGLPKSPSGPS